MGVSAGNLGAGLRRRKQWMRHRLDEHGREPLRRWAGNVAGVLGWLAVVSATLWLAGWLVSSGFEWGSLIAAIAEGSMEDGQGILEVVAVGAAVLGGVVVLVTAGPARQCARRVITLRPWQPHPGLPVPQAPAGRVHARVDKPWLRGTGDMLAMASRRSASEIAAGDSTSGPQGEDPQDGTVPGVVEVVEQSAGDKSAEAVSESVVDERDDGEAGPGPETGLVFRVLGLNDGITAVPLEVLAYVVTEGQGVIVPRVAARVMGVSLATMRRRCARLRADGWLRDLKDKAYSLAEGVHTDIDELADALASDDKDAAVAIARTVRHRPLVQLNAEWFDGDQPSVRESVTREVHNLLMECSEKFDNDEAFSQAADAIYGQ